MYNLKDYELTAWTKFSNYAEMWMLSTKDVTMTSLDSMLYMNEIVLIRNNKLN